jgi:hypothetical protein
MSIIVKQMMDEPIILITYRRLETEVDEAIHKATTIAKLLREIGDFAYVILDISGHSNSFQTIYNTIQGALKQDIGKLTNPSQSIIVVGSSTLIAYHHAEIITRQSDMIAWHVTHDLDHAIAWVRAKIDEDELSLQFTKV